jgi:hypothetical protein
MIDPHDSVYEHLRIWIDANHDGISQPHELHTLRELGVFKIDLKYQLSTMWTRTVISSDTGRAFGMRRTDLTKYATT